MNHLILTPILLTLAVTSTSSLPRKLIIDTDGGADDAMAIIAGLNLPSDTKLMAITTSCGNVNATQAAINVLKVLRVLGRTEVPVHRGCQSYYMTSEDISSTWFGEDGLGDFEFDNPPTENDISSEHGVMTLLRLVKEYPGEISLVCLGPVTNIALAIKMDPSFLKNLHQIIVMGGSIKGMGNITPGTEFNFRRDPEAAKLLFEHSSKEHPVYLLPYETSQESKIDKHWRTSVFGELNSSLVSFINKAEHIALARTPRYWTAPDQLAMLVLIRAEFVRKIDHAMVYVCAEGTMSRGVTLVDRSSKSGNTRIVKKVDVDLFKKFLIEAFQSNRIDTLDNVDCSPCS
uniref:Probable uridine nucleosidase 2 n=1 Tax=Cacopsylla melanoneura TaxID=428564 RepID=A0A8D9DYR0_9HEMI